MSYQTELSTLAVGLANSSFANVSKLSRLVAIYGDKKDIKNSWIFACESNGLVKATALDYWVLASFFKRIFTSYTDAKNALVGTISERLNALGVTSVKTMKSYKIAFSKVQDFSESLKNFRTMQDNDDLECLINACLIPSQSLANLNQLLANIDVFLALEKAKNTVDAPTVDAPTVDAPTVDAPTVDAPTVDAPTVDAPTVDAPTVDAPTVDAPTVDAPTVDAPTVDAPTVDFALTRLAILNALTGNELLDLALKMDNDTLAMLQKAIGNELKTRNKKAA